MYRVSHKRLPFLKIEKIFFFYSVMKRKLK